MSNQLTINCNTVPSGGGGGTSTTANGITFSYIDTDIYVTDGQRTVVLADRNMGATSSGADPTPANIGAFFQRGNNSGFTIAGAPYSPSATTVVLSAYSSANPYGNTTMRSTCAYFTPDTQALRGVVSKEDTSATQDTPPAYYEYVKILPSTVEQQLAKGPCPLGYHVPTSAEFNLLWRMVLTYLGVPIAYHPYNGFVNTYEGFTMNIKNQIRQLLKAPKPGDLDYASGTYTADPNENYYTSWRCSNNKWGKAYNSASGGKFRERAVLGAGDGGLWIEAIGCCALLQNIRPFKNRDYRYV